MGDANLEITDDDTRRCRLLLLISKGGGLVLRHKLQKELTTRKKKIDDNDIESKITHVKDCISEVQYKRIYPDSGSSSPEDYDITLLVFLLRTLFYKTKDPKWKSGYSLNDTDISDIAEIVRIRELRNKVKHQYEDGKLDETTFNDLWTRCEKVLVRFGGNDIADLPNKLEKLKSEPIDKKRLEDLLEQWEKLDEDMENRVIETIKQHSARVNAHDRSKKEVSHVLEDKYFVKTSMFKQANKMLNTYGVIVIKGAQGEGKTTMGKKLVQNPAKCLKINSVADWDMYSSKDDVETILIDDMFGCTVFDKSESRKWLKIFPQLMSEVSKKKMKLIITSRSYILDDAQKKLFIEHHIRECNIIEISSKKLKSNEKKLMLKKHMKLNRRKLRKYLIKDCAEQSDKPSSFIIGFPECARLFSIQDSLFHKGSAFFKAPMTHIKTCLDTIFKRKYVFLAFFVLWSQPLQKLRLFDLEQSPVKTHITIKRPIEHLGYSLYDSLRHIRNVFSSHKDFVPYDDINEIFKFRHTVLGDAVGLVAFARNTTAALEFCNASFIVRYIRIYEQSETNGDNDNDESIIIPQNRYDHLCSVIGKILLPDRTIRDTDIQNLRDHVCSVFGQTSPSKRNESDAVKHVCSVIDQMSRKGSDDGQNMNCTILLHSAFKQISFCKIFFETLKNEMRLSDFLTKPVSTCGASVLSIKEILHKHEFESEIRVLSYAVKNSHSPYSLASLCFSEMSESKNDDMENILKTNLKMSLLVAVESCNFEKVSYLMSEMNAVSDDFSLILCAIKKANCEIMKILLEKNKMSKYRKNGKSPLMFFVEADNVSAIEFLESNQFIDDDELNYVCINTGETALHLACKTGNDSIVKLLLKMSPKLYLQDYNGYLPIYSAVFKNKKCVLRQLLEHDQKQMDCLWKNMPLFHVAIMYGKEDLIQLLIDLKMPITCKDKDMQSPVAFALKHKNLYMIEPLVNMMIEQKAHNMQDSTNETVLDIAVDKYVNEQKETEVYWNVIELHCKREDEFTSHDGGTDMTVKDIIGKKKEELEEKIKTLENDKFDCKSKIDKACDLRKQIESLNEYIQSTNTELNKDGYDAIPTDANKSTLSKIQDKITSLEEQVKQFIDEIKLLQERSDNISKLIERVQSVRK